MRNKVCFLLLILTMFGFTGCYSAETNPEQIITMASKYQNTADETLEIAFLFQGELVIPGKKLPDAVAAAAVTVTEVSSCTGAGKDTLYQYDGFDITVHNGGNNNPVYSIFFLSSDVSTAEGLSIGDSLNKVHELYGDANTQGDYAWIYSDGHAELILMLSEDTVVGIEYRKIG